MANDEISNVPGLNYRQPFRHFFLRHSSFELRHFPPMETSLHRELKLLYAGRQARYEVSLAGNRIDAIARGRLIEIQHGSLGAIRDKIRNLLESHRVTIVKPIIATKVLVKKAAKGGEEL